MDIENRQELNIETITFGKYKDKTLSDVLKDRNYCKWIVKQEWFEKNYSFLFNKINTYKPLQHFILETYSNLDIIKPGFINEYKFFNLCPINKVTLTLSETDKTCYGYYLELIEDLKNRIRVRIDKDDENPYDIKALSRWLLKFEKKYKLQRIIFKDFLYEYDLPNIPYIIERIKKEGGLEYKGAQSFNIAKSRSLEQEKYWEDILKMRYGEDICAQFKYDKCIFDFLNIKTNTIFECKLSLNDFNEDQHKKYNITLRKYRIIYLISKDCVIDMERKGIYTTNKNKYSLYIQKLDVKVTHTYLDTLIQYFNIIEIADLSTLFGTTS